MLNRAAARPGDAISPLAEGRAPEIVDLLLTVGFIDGLFHDREREFVEQYLDAVIAKSAPADTGAIGMGMGRIRGDERASFEAIYKRLLGEVQALAAEVVASSVATYIPTKLKGRALKIFGGLSPVQQEAALELVGALIKADGKITPQEQGLYDELAGYFAAAKQRAASAPTLPPSTPVPAEVAAASASLTMPAAAPAPTRMQVLAPRWLELRAASSPLLDPLEHTYSPHPQELKAQVALDYQLVTQTISMWQRLRQRGNGRLVGVTDIGQLPVGSRFLDDHVHVLRPDRPVELIVLGDLHGCYGCLKAAILQSGFVERAWAHQWDPANHPEVKLVLLGDYIDRGLYSFDGVLRAVLRLFLAMPDHVIVLRGNHEYFLSTEKGVMSAVKPAEALSSLSPHVPREMLEAYRILFEHMPTAFLFERNLFVHGGIAREDTFAQKYRDLSSLNEPELRFQMMWSDPTQTDAVPVTLQRQNPRFEFGREQFRAFMDRIGMQTMIRGHEKIDQGFQVVYDFDGKQLLNLFSAGGHDNCDLPVGASYRTVTPMAMTIQHNASGTVGIPWPIQYQPFNFDPHNGFHRPLPLLEFREV